MIDNKNKKVKGILTAAVIFAAAACVTSCSTPKNVTYFQDATPEELITVAQAQPIRVEPGNKLSIVVNTRDASVSALFNLPVYTTSVGKRQYNRVGAQNNATMTGSAATSEGIAAYTVDDNGDIDFPVLGKIHVAGMTRQEVAGFIKGELMGRDLVKDATVTVEFLNAYINVMGDVNVPGMIEINRDNLTITDALSMAGDLRLHGQRENVKVFRKEGDKMRTYVVDLTDANKTMSSPVYYMKQGDIIYVEYNDVIKRTNTVSGNSVLTPGFWISVASLLTTVATTIGVFVRN